MVLQTMSVFSMSWLPVELYDDILRELWASRLTPAERTELLVTLPLVHRSWLSVFAQVAMTDVHISNPQYARHYLRLLPGSPITGLDEPRSLWTAATSAESSRCRSLSFYIQGDSTLFPVQLYRVTNAMGDTLSNTLYVIDTLGYLPNLRKLSIEYTNWGFDDLFDHYRLCAFPSQITQLSLKYSYNESIPTLPASLKEYLCATYVRHRCTKCSLPGIRNLSLDGVPIEFVADILGICPNTETLQVEASLADHLKSLYPLSETVHTIVLRNTEPAERDARLDSVLAKSILQCCFPSLRIIMECDMDRQAGNRVGELSHSRSLDILRSRGVPKF